MFKLNDTKNGITIGGFNLQPEDSAAPPFPGGKLILAFSYYAPHLTQAGVSEAKWTHSDTNRPAEDLAFAFDMTRADAQGTTYDALQAIEKVRLGLSDLGESSGVSYKLKTEAVDARGPLGRV